MTRVGTAAMADAAIAAHPLIGGFATSKDLKAKGRTTFHSRSGFLAAFWNAYKSRPSNAKALITGAISEAALRKASDKEARGTAGFADQASKHIHINLANATRDTVIHEALHLHSTSNKFGQSLGGEEVQEGATDLLTLMVCKHSKIPFKDGYRMYRLAMEVLKNAVGFGAFASTYFSGTTQVMDALELKGKGTTKRYAKLLGQKKWQAAARLLTGVKEARAKKKREDDNASRDDTRKENEKQAEEQQRKEAERRKGWPKEAAKPFSARVSRAVDLKQKGTRIELAAGGNRGMRKGWIGTLYDKRGKPVAGGSFVVTKVFSGTAVGIVSIPYSTIRDGHPMRARLAPPKR